VEGKGGGSKN